MAQIINSNIPTFNTEPDKLTEAQEKQIYDELSVNDSKSTEDLKNAENETNNSKYTEISDIDSKDKIIPLNEENNNISEQSYHEVFNEYDLSDDDAASLLGIINRYINGNPAIDYYDELPQKIKDLVNGIIRVSASRGNRMGRKAATSFILEELINDAKFSEAMNSMQEEINKSAIAANKEYNKIFTEAFEDVFSKIDEIEKENPEQAKKIRSVKKAFDDAKTFNIQMDFAKKISINKLNKLTKRFDNEIIYFNKKVNVTDVHIPNVGELLPIIKRELPQYDINDIKKFIIVLCMSVINYDLENDVTKLAYVYKMINNIYIYKFVENLEDNDTSTLLFKNIASVIDCIINK